MKQIAELSITLNASNCKVGSTTLHFFTSISCRYSSKVVTILEREVFEELRYLHVLTSRSRRNVAFIPFYLQKQIIHLPTHLQVMQSELL